MVNRSGRSAHANQDLWQSLPPVLPELQLPRIEITRFWHRRSGFDTSEFVAWTIKAIGLNGQPIPKEDEMLSQEDAEHIAAQWHALLGWPMVRLKQIVRTQLVIEEEDDASS